MAAPEPVSLERDFEMRARSRCHEPRDAPGASQARTRLTQPSTVVFELRERECHSLPLFAFPAYLVFHVTGTLYLCLYLGSSSRCAAQSHSYQKPAIIFKQSSIHRSSYVTYSPGNSLTKPFLDRWNFECPHLLQAAFSILRR